MNRTKSDETHSTGDNKNYRVTRNDYNKGKLRNNQDVEENDS